MKYLVKIEPERLFTQNEEFQQAFLTQVYAQLANNPFIDLEALTQKLVYAFFRGEGEGLMKRQVSSAQVAGQSGQSETPQTIAGQQAINRATASGMANVLTR